MDLRTCRCVFCLLVVLFLAAKAANQKDNSLPLVSYKTVGINCIGNPDFLVNITCKLRPINWQKTVAVMDSDLVGVVRNATFNVQLLKWTYTNQFRPFVINVTTNICNMLNTGSGNSYAKVALKMIKTFSTINHKCPFSGHLAARDIYLDSSILTFPMPTGKYKFKCSFYEGWPLVHIGTVEVIFSAVITDRNNPRKQNRPKMKMLSQPVV